MTRLSRITRSRWFWGAHCLFFLTCLCYALRTFPTAFPFVELEVKMSRKEALEAAAKLAGDRAWAPGPAAGAYRQAVTFDIDSSTQNFIELEAGGPSALAKVLKDGVYAPYVWRVRHFAEGKTNETHVRFRPGGSPDGFYEKLSEDDPGAALTSEQARAIAESVAARDWGIVLKGYRLEERSQEVRRGKRVDHSFIYEKEGEEGKVGEGRYRIRLGVSGDRLTEVRRFIKVPEAFHRRYSSMRSANGTISALAFAAIALLYGLLGAGLGILSLARRHWVQWRAPIAVAGAISGLGFLETINQLPLEWMGYDTAISSTAFLIRAVTNGFFGNLVDFIVMALSLMAAESLTRRAFPSHPQLWRVFSREAAGSKAILGRVLGAYLAVGFDFVFVIWIYGVGSRHLGWWNPSDILFHPDALATYLPWLTSVASSLHAGVWEECLFRAVPLASAALLGARYGRRGLWIGAAFVLQAVIFGAAHASYPTQPSYARVVELIIPSFWFGGIYLAFGLLPGILVHYLYDVVLFAMPIFQSEGTTAWVNGAIVVMVSGLPAWITLRAGVRQGGWGELAPGYWNSGWSPAEALAAAPAREEPGPAAPSLSARARNGLLAAGVAGLALWCGVSRFAADAPPLKVGRDRAIALAREELGRRGVKLGPGWKALAAVEDGAGEDDVFVWRTSGEDTYRALMGTYLDPPQWKVRFARFEGDLVERAEEHQVFIAGAGQVDRVRHELPEARPGKSLDEKEARALAAALVRSRYGLDPSGLKEVSSQQYKLPSRRDWLFLWADPAVVLKEGEARVAVRVSGDEVAGFRRYVDVPEEWTRKERSKRTMLGVAKTIGGAWLALMSIGLSIWAVYGWIHHVFRIRAFLAVLGVVIALGALSDANDYPSAVARFATSQSISSQLTRWLTREALGTLLTACLPAIWAGYIHGRLARGRRAGDPRARPWAGYAMGAVIGALLALAGALSKGSSPRWPALSSAAWPVLEGLGSLSMSLLVTSFLMLVFLAAAALRESRGWARGPWLRGAWFAMTGFALGGSLAEPTLLSWALTGGAVSLGMMGLDWFLRRTTVSLLVPIVAVGTVLSQVRQLAAPGYPGAAGAAVLGILAVGVGSWIWFDAVGRGPSVAGD